MITYKKFNDDEGNWCSIIKKVDNVQVASIPLVEANTDYQEYLEWLAEGNTPEEAE